MKKLLGILLSLCMVMCFMPSLAFADEGSEEPTLTEAQIASAKTIEDGQDILKDIVGGETVVYKFTVPEGKYGFLYEYEDGSESWDDPEMKLFKTNAYGQTMFLSEWPNNGNAGEGSARYFTQDEAEAGDEVYMSVKNPESAMYKNMVFTVFKSAQVKIKCTAGGKVRERWSTKTLKKIEMTETVGGEYVTVVPKAGYVFKGFYNGKTKLKTSERSSDSYGVIYSKAAVGKTITAKFVKATKAQKKILNTKIVKIKGTVDANGGVKATWETSTGVKFNEYEIDMSPKSDPGSIWGTWSETNSLDDPNYGLTPDTWTIKIRGVKTVGGVKVVTPWAKATMSNI